MEIIHRPPEPLFLCTHCQSTVENSDKFCGNCGKEIHTTTIPSRDIFEVIGPTLFYYFVTLILLATWKITNAFPDGFEGMVFVSVIDIVMVTAFWIHYRKELARILSLSGLKLGVLVVIISGAAASAVFVSILADLINVSIFDNVYYNPYLFQDTDSPFLWIVVFTCIMPAIFEEIAFRGFLFSNISAVTSARGAMYVTSFLFGIIHLSFVSLIWLIPLGIVFAWLRIRYNTLWYGIVAHFAYNFFVSVIEFMDFRFVTP